jgi:hypothetical protein
LTTLLLVKKLQKWTCISDTVHGNKDGVGYLVKK